VSRTLVRNGAELIAIITNDAWFDGTAGPAQHAAHAVLRAVETGRWVVRAANTGVSMVVDPSGRVRAAAPAATTALLTAEVSLQRAPTPYVRWGDRLVWMGMLAVVAASAPRLWRAVREQRRHPAFAPAVAATALPTVAVMALLSAGAAWWTWVAALLAFTVLFSIARAPAPQRLHRLGGAAAAGAGMAVTAGLWAIMLLAYRAAGMPLSFDTPAGGWPLFALRQVLVAGAIEGWLRGVAFDALAGWGGPIAAVAVTTALGMALQTGLAPESYAWALLTGVAFGLIRTRTGSGIGLIVPHTVGNLLFSVVALVR
jgi:hypothetical protein